MQPLKHPLRLLGLIALPLGIGLAVLAAALYFVDPIATLAIGINAAIWLPIGVICVAIVSTNNKRLRSLKEDGALRFDGEVVNIITNHYINTGTGVAARAEVVYVNSQGQRCLVKSALFTTNRFGKPDDIAATVYVDRFNPEKYAVELARVPIAKEKYDVDYR